ncbi:MAG TPA: peptidoglycan recognition family protein [Verrucomicrobiae bacterium]|nr:peptidoglycan recognition family protein [Verrucomicrobiae bacterium]
MFSSFYAFVLLPVLLLLMAGCKTAPRPGTFVPRTGDEIVVCGQFFHTGTPVVLWMDPGGYDAYRVERRFVPFEDSSWRTSAAQDTNLTTPNRYGIRTNGLTPEQLERVRGGGWDLALLRSKVDQFVIHFDDAGTSRQCFKILQDKRDLSVQFMLDLDGTIYQTLDCKERAWQATKANSRSVGVEIANMGAYHSATNRVFQEWYKREPNGRVDITIPPELGDGGIRTKGFVGHPARTNLIEGNVQGEDWVQYDYTPQQYAALVKLTASLCKIFPKLQCRYPTDAAGHLITHKLPDDDYNAYSGVLGHYHVQTDKEDPGPAFNWDYVIGNAQLILHHGFSPAADAASMGEMRNRF